MAKYDWKQLEKEYVLSDYKSISAFLKDKNIPNNGSTRKQTNGWNETKKQKQDKIKTKTVQKVIEKESEKEANKIVSVKDTANTLLLKINDSIEELNKYFSRDKVKKKTIEYDYEVSKPSKEVIEEIEEIKEFYSIIDKAGLKQLTSALKDLNDILDNKESQNNDGIINDLIGALKDAKKD